MSDEASEDETPVEELKPKKNLQPGDFHPYWREWRWDGEAFERA